MTLNKLFSIYHSCQGSFVRGRMRLLSIYLVYLFRCIPEEDKLLTGDGLLGFLSWWAAVFLSCQFAFTFRRTSFTSCRLESRSPEESSSWSSGGKSARLPVQAGGCSGRRPGGGTVRGGFNWRDEGLILADRQRQIFQHGVA